VDNNTTKESLNKLFYSESYGWEYVYTTTYTQRNIVGVYTLV